MIRGTLDPISNRATWSDYGVILDAETHELVDISGADEITLIVSDQSGCNRITGTLSGGEITVPDTGVYSWVLSSAQMSALYGPQTYQLAIRIEINDEIIQLVLAHLPVLSGLR